MIHIFDDLEALSEGAAELLTELAARSTDEGRSFSVALSGGETPRRTYELLASSPHRGRIEWATIHVFWGDERCVPSDHPASNARMARESLLDHVPIPGENVHLVQGAAPPSEASLLYERTLRRHFAGDTPRFDLVFLGMGEDGHTASLFPDAAVLDERRRLAVDVRAPGNGLPRITLTLPVFNSARNVCFLIAGEHKARTLATVLEGPRRRASLPAQRVAPERGELRWYVDRAAASALEASPRIVSSGNR